MVMTAKVSGTGFVEVSGHQVTAFPVPSDVPLEVRGNDIGVIEELGGMDRQRRPIDEKFVPPFFNDLFCCIDIVHILWKHIMTLNIEEKIGQHITLQCQLLQSKREGKVPQG